MPYSASTATPILASSLVSVGNIGTGVGKFAAGVAYGIDGWIHTINVQTVDTGTLGAGTGIIPLLIPNPLLLTGITVGFTGQGIMGLLAPLTITGLTNGIVTSLAAALVKTTHPSVGVGTAVVRFSAGSSTQAMIQGFQSQGMNTSVSVKVAKAIAQGLDSALAALVLISPIVGASSPTGASGVGSGTIL